MIVDLYMAASTFSGRALFLIECGECKVVTCSELSYRFEAVWICFKNPGLNHFNAHAA